jgi:hypothetical protein
MTLENTTPTPNQTPSAPTSAFEALVGPGKKFGSHEDLAKGKLESDAFVAKVTSENKELRSIVQELSAKVDNLSARDSILNQLSNNSNGSVNQPNVQNTQQPVVTPPASLSAEDVKKLISDSEANKLVQDNIRKADAGLTKALGADAVPFVKQRAAELGMPVDEIMGVAARSPDAFFSMLGLNPNSADPKSMYRGSNTAPGAPNAPIRNNSYYEKVKAEKGVRAFVLDTNLQIQLHKDMQTLGDAFFT